MYDPRTKVASHHGGDHSYGYGYANRERKVGLSYEGCINWLGDSNGDYQEGVVHLRPEALQGINDDEYGFGFCASPSWQDSPSPARSPSQPLLGHNTHRSSLPQNSRVQTIARGQKELHNAYRSLSPNSRVQAIVRGQRELMEMVKNMPESSYELSLKDLVENDKVENQNLAPGSPTAQEDKPGSGNNTGSGVKVGQKTDNKHMRRSGSFEHKGLFLKMGLPVKSPQKRSNSGGNNNNDNISGGIGKAPPKPVIGERDWWKKKFTASSDSDSSRTSNTSGSTRSTSSSSGNSSSYGSRRKKDGFRGGCWPFFQSRRKFV